MTSLASLVLQVNATSVGAATTSLNQLAAAGVNAQTATNNLTRATQQANTSILANQQAWFSNAAAINSSTNALSHLANGFKSAFFGASIAVGLIELKNNLINLTDTLIHTQVQVDKLRNSLNFAVGRGAAAGDLAFIKQSAQDMGLSFVTVTEQYVRLAAASRQTSLEGQKTKDIFTAVSQASTVLGLSADETTGALRAITQMISKNTVMSEELKGQLGERLPGAFQIAARAMGVTTQELNKMLETGKVLAEDFLPKFAAQLMRETAPDIEAASQSMQASLNRLETAWTLFKQAVVKSGVGQSLSEETSGLANYFAVLSESMDRSRESGAGLSSQLMTGLGTALARMPFDVVNTSANLLNGTINLLSGGFVHLSTNVNVLPQMFETSAYASKMLGERLTSAEQDLASLQAKLAIVPDNIYLKDSTYQAYLLVQQLKAAKQAQDSLSGNAGRGNINPETVAQLEASAERRQQIINDLMLKSSGISDAYIKRAKEIQEANADGGLSADQLRIALDGLHKLLPKVTSAKMGLSEAQKLINAGEKAYGDIMASETGYAANFTETVLSLVAARDKNNWSSEKYNEVIAAYMAQQPGAIKATKELDKELDLLVKSMDDFTAAAREADAEKAQAKRAIDGYVKGIEESAAALEFELGMMGQSEQSRARAIEQNAIYAESLKKIAEIMADTAWGTDLAARDAAVVAVRVATAIKTSTAAGRATLAEWNRTFDTIESGLVSALMTGGKEGGKAARDLIAKMLILEPFEIIVKAYLQPVTTALTNLALDATGLASSVSGTGGIMGMANSGSSLYSAGSKVYDWVGGLFPTTPSIASETATVAALNDWFGVSALSGSSGSAALGISTGSVLETGGVLGSGAWGAGTETLAGTLGTGVFDTGIAAAAPTLAAPAVEAAVGVAAEGIMGSIGSAVAAIPVWGWAIAGIGALLAMGNDSTPSYNTGDSNLTFNPDGTVKAASTEHGDSTASLSYAAGLQDSYVKAATSLGLTMAETNFVTGSNSGKDASDPQVVFASSVNGQSYQSAETQAADTAAVELAASRAVFSALQASEMPKYLAGAFDGITASTATQEEITAALEGATALKGFHDQLQLMPWDSLKDMTYATTQALVDMSGGLDALQTNLGTFYDNFYTDAEKTALLTTNTTEAFAALGITMPAVDDGMRDWYRGLVDSVLALDQSDAANAGATVAVLALQGAVDELAPAFTDATKAIEEYQGWQDKLDVLTGVTTERAQQQAADLAAAADDQTRALINQVYAAEDAADAAQVVADSMQSLTDALKTMADETAGIIASMGDIGKTDFQKSISQIIRDGETNQATLNTYATGASTVTSATPYSAPASQSPSRFTTEQDASIKSFIAGLDWSAAGTAASSTMLLSAMTEAGVSLEDLSNLGYATADLKNVASFATQEINNALVAANPIMAYTSSNYSNWGGPAESGGSFVGPVGTGSTGSGTSASAADNTNAKLNSAYAEQLQIIMDSYQPDMQQIDAMAALKTAGFVIDDLDATGIKKYFFDLASAADPLTTEGKATIDALDALTNQIALLGQVATERQAWQDKLDVLSLKTTQRALDLQRDLASTTDAATQSLIKQVYAFEDASAAIATRFNDSKSATDTAFSVLQKSVDAQRDVVNETINNVTDIIDSIDSAVKQLRGEANPLGQFDAAQSWLDNALTNAKLTGYLPDTQELSDAISTLSTGLDETVYASEADASFNKLVVAGKLQELGDIAKPQLTTAQQQLADLDKILDTAQAQLDALNGINNSVLSVADALANFNSATKNQAGATVPSGGTVAMVAPAGTQYNGDEIKSIQDLYTVNLGRVGDAGGMAYWAGQFMADGVIDAAEKQAFALASIPEYKAAHGLATGTNYVPYDGFQATLHEGEAVIPKVYNPAAGAQTNARLEALVETLTIEVQRLQSIVNDGNKSNDRIASTLENVTEGGANMRTVAA